MIVLHDASWQHSTELLIRLSRKVGINRVIASRCTLYGARVQAARSLLQRGLLNDDRHLAIHQTARRTRRHRWRRQSLLPRQAHHSRPAAQALGDRIAAGDAELLPRFFLTDPILHASDPPSPPGPPSPSPPSPSSGMDHSGHSMGEGKSSIAGVHVMSSFIDYAPCVLGVRLFFSFSSSFFFLSSSSSFFFSFFFLPLFLLSFVFRDQRGCRGSLARNKLTKKTRTFIPHFSFPFSHGKQKNSHLRLSLFFSFLFLFFSLSFSRRKQHKN